MERKGIDNVRNEAMEAQRREVNYALNTRAEEPREYRNDNKRFPLKVNSFSSLGERVQPGGGYGYCPHGNKHSGMYRGN
jgi:hypothetical protein